MSTIESRERDIRTRALNLKARLDAKGKQLSPSEVTSFEAELAQINADKKRLEADKMNALRFGHDADYTATDTKAD
jgi:hypothetical protein